MVGLPVTGAIRPPDPAESDLPWMITGKVLPGDRGLPTEGGHSGEVVCPALVLLGDEERFGTEETAGEPGLCLPSSVDASALDEGSSWLDSCSSGIGSGLLAAAAWSVWFIFGEAIL